MRHSSLRARARFTGLRSAAPSWLQSSNRRLQAKAVFRTRCHSHKTANGRRHGSLPEGALSPRDNRPVVPKAEAMFPPPRRQNAIRCRHSGLSFCVFVLIVRDGLTRCAVAVKRQARRMTGRDILCAVPTLNSPQNVRSATPLCPLRHRERESCVSTARRR